MKLIKGVELPPKTKTRYVSNLLCWLFISPLFHSNLFFPVVFCFRKNSMITIWSWSYFWHDVQVFVKIKWCWNHSMTFPIIFVFLFSFFYPELSLVETDLGFARGKGEVFKTTQNFGRPFWSTKKFFWTLGFLIVFLTWNCR